MKNYAKVIFLLFVFLIIIPISSGDHSFSLKYELNSSGINRALQQQYNQIGFPNVVIREWQGITCTLYLKLPSILFEDNNIKLYMSIACSSSVGNFGQYIFKPTILVETGTITSSQIIGFLSDFPQKVQAISEIPEWLKSLIIDQYNSFKPWLFPSKLVKELNNSSEWLKQRNVDIKPPEQNGVTLGYQINSNKLILLVTITVNSGVPQFPFRINYIQGTENEVVFHPNIKTFVHYYKLWDSSQQEVIETYPNIWCEKDQNTFFTCWHGRLVSAGMYTAYIIYKTFDIDGNTQTFYVRKYVFQVIEGSTQGFIHSSEGIN